MAQPCFGIVKWFNNAKGYGFLGQDGGDDIFVHFTSIQTEGYKTLKVGEVVTFEIVYGAKGPQADRVKRVTGVRLDGHTLLGSSE